ncbi:helix-turn-helix transcriptional regulator [Paeniglutamicibacter antarcticus]|uniref:helix-turn-helix transcriptional regulator n=1 Tax=Paeniglutamicibacter antarcticus TaxID=494023 RepID=UPI0031EEDA8E
MCAAAVAAAVGISERHLSRIFAEAGESLGSDFRERRLQLATEILTGPAHGSMPVGRISRELGFASQSCFPRVFKARFGITPLALRRESVRASAT